MSIVSGQWSVVSGQWSVVAKRKYGVWGIGYGVEILERWEYKNRRLKNMYLVI